MRKYQHILCPIDFSQNSEQALIAALSLKKDLGAQLTVVHFVEPLPAIAYSMGVNQVIDEIISHAQQKMAHLAERLQFSDYDKVDAKIQQGYPKKDITQLAQKLAADLIIIGSHGHHGFIDHFIGSTTDAVMHRSAAADVFVIHHREDSATAR